jgi:transcriptional regulator with XRE-family HTH domain
MFNNNYALTEIPRHELGSNIQVYRQMKEMSQSELAKAAGYRSRSSINKIENNQTVPNAIALAKIAHALRINCDNLFYGCDMKKYKDLYKQTCAIFKMNHINSKDNVVVPEIADISQENELDFIVENILEYNEITESLKQSEQVLKKYQKVITDFQRLAKRFKKGTPKLQEDKDLVYKYHQITPEHQKTITNMLNGFYQLDLQTQKNATTADSDGENTGTQKGTPSLQ